MAIWYIDPLQGNNANSGLTYALRKQSFSGITAGLVAGDEIRLVETEAPSSIGNATWTDNSGTLTLGTPLNFLQIDPSTAAWTGAANVTTSASTTVAERRAATQSKFVIATAFTTGKIAHRTLPATVNASGFEAITFMIYPSVASTVDLRNLTLRLCSDTTGDVPVLTINLGTALAQRGLGATAAVTWASGRWVTFTFDNVTALPSNINSISLAALADPVTPSFTISNILAVKGRANAAHFNYDTLFSKGTTAEPEWYPLGYVDSATSIRLITATKGVTTPLNTYRGVTATVPTLKVNPEHHFPTAAQRTTQVVSGTEAAPINVTFGWTRASSMSSQTGHSYVTGGGFSAYYGIGNSFWRFTGPVTASAFATNAFGFNGTCAYVEVDISAIADLANTTTTDLMDGRTCSGVFRMDNICWVGAGIQIVSPWTVRTAIRRITGLATTGTTAFLFLPNATQAGLSSQASDCVVGQIDNSQGVALGSASSGFPVYLKGTTFRNNTATVAVSGTSPAILDGCTSLDPSLFATAYTSTTEIPSVRFSKFGGDVTNNQIHTAFWRAITQSAVRSTPSGKAWECTIKAAAGRGQSLLMPASISLARVASNAGTINVTVAVRRSAATMTAGIRVMGGLVQGVPDTVASVSSIGAFQDVTLTITPTESGVVEIEGFFRGAVNDVAYFDNVRIS